MKKLAFALALCMVAGVSFGQKKAVTAAKREVKNQKPNVTEARSQIESALKDAETANQAETYYVAGLVEEAGFNKEYKKFAFEEKPNEEEMYTSLDKVVPYFIVADSLDKLPNEKGKIKPKFGKDMRKRLKENRAFFLNAGNYFYTNQNYQKAFDNFKLYVDLPNLNIMQGEKIEAIPDSMVTKISYIAGMVAMSIPDYDAAIDVLSTLKEKDVDQFEGLSSVDLYKNLIFAYEQKGDTENFKKTLEEGSNKFPEDSYFILNLINASLSAGEITEAIQFLNKAIELSPYDATLLDLLGVVYENSDQPEKAIENMKKATTLEPENVSYLNNLGRVYYNLAVAKRGEADALPLDNKTESEALMAESIANFKAALPYFEKAFEIDNKNTTAMMALYNIYYSLQMGPEYEKMEKLLNAQ